MAASDHAQQRSGSFSCLEGGVHRWKAVARITRLLRARVQIMHLNTPMLRGVIVARGLLLRTTFMDVSAWLRGLDLKHYAPAFRDNDIDAEILSQLTAEDLIGLGVTSIGRRCKLLAAIAALRGARPAPAAAAPWWGTRARAWHRRPPWTFPPHSVPGCSTGPIDRWRLAADKAGPASDSGGTRSRLPHDAREIPLCAHIQ
jgi:SAM domain (Sterile alpha motif)